jgi:hypothetical protein
MHVLLYHNSICQIQIQNKLSMDNISTEFQNNSFS